MKKRSILLVFLSFFLVACANTGQSTSESSQETVSTNQESGSKSETTTSSTQEQVISDNLIIERYDVSYGNKQLYGMITAPENYRDLQLPLMIVSHGFNNTLEQFQDYTQFLASLGYVVYSFDFYGGSLQSKSGGQDMLDMSVQTELEDLTQVVTTLSKEAFIVQDSISLLGASQGGVVSTLYAASHPDSVANLILIFPAFVLFDDVRQTYDSYGVASAKQLPDVVSHKNARLGKRYLTDAMGISINEEMAKVTAPTLIIQGTDDDVVPYSYAVSASQIIPSAQLVTVQGGGHWISDDFNTVAQPAIQSFLGK